MIRTVIIDDQQECIDDLHYLFKKLSLPLEVVATANTGSEGLAAILKNKPQLVLLDVVMPGMSGFELLELLPEINFHLIITTSEDKFAMQAIRYSALDFLLKPVNEKELKNAIIRVDDKLALPKKTQIDLLQQSLKQRGQTLKKIAIPVSDGIELINLEDILFFESDGNYSTIHLKNEKNILVSKPIGKFEEMIGDNIFFRVHSSYLVNLNFIKKYSRSDGGYVVLENGKSLSVARNRKEELVEALSNI